MEQRPAIFKLNLDCFDHVFDYLALKDLGQFSQTCKAMKWAVGEYYQANCVTIIESAELRQEKLYLFDLAMGYSDFVQRLRICLLGGEDCFVKRDLSIKVKELEIHSVKLTEPQLHRLEYMLSNAEILVIVNGYDNSDEFFYETVPNMCNNLKRLHMRDFLCEKVAQAQEGNKWLLHEYPRLEHLEWTQSDWHGCEINEFKAFFELNPHVRSFATNVRCLCDSHHLIIASGFKLDDLTIEVNDLEYQEYPEMIRDACILLNELYENGFYKRLHLKFTRHWFLSDKQFIQQTIDQIIPINAVRSMNLPSHPNLNLSRLVNLTELRIAGEEMGDVDMMASYLVNLERIDLNHAYLNQMLSFIYHSVKLKKLRVTRFVNEDEDEDEDKVVSALDLAYMNKRREQLLDARKVTIFIDERYYLATKWALKLAEFRLIEMRRDTAHDWEHHFGPY